LHRPKYGENNDAVQEQQIDLVEFFTTGDQAFGRYRCSDCRYGVSIQRELPLCPMCGGTSWELLLDADREQPFQ
jgi:rubredoxin